jgi:mono/diheme cytochrome c family protein
MALPSIALLSTARQMIVAISMLATLGLGSLALLAQTLKYHRTPDAANGRAIYRNGCVTCHGENGNGAPESSTVFKRPGTFPDFSRCDQTTPEGNYTWKAIITDGGPSLGFSTIMPSFSGVLSSDQIDDVVAYLRTFCTNPHWPRGELNLPRALVTEKAFPEDELVLSTDVNASGAPGFTIHAIHEQVISTRDQIEVDVPWDVQDLDHGYANHIGDITLGLKHVMFSSLRSGSILSLQAGVLPPTGSTKLGAAGTTVFEPFASFDQLFRSNTWVQFQMGADLPHDTRASPQSLFYYTAIGQTLGQNHMLGRQWSPMVEFLATRDLEDGAKTDWDVMPEMQVTLSRRQHIRVDVGVREPFTDTAGRVPTVNFYVLWDWADGKFWEGWK